MQTCTKCLLNENYPGIVFDDKGVCNFCKTNRQYSPLGEDILIRLFDEIKKRNYVYDALVPISGGKDSSYILYLATKVYHLNVITMTYDNGFFSQLALDNIKKAVKITNVKHIFYKPDKNIQQKVFRNAFRLSGDMCGACDIATKASVYYVSRKYKVPIILYGNTPLEEDSFIPDDIQDVKRLKYILRESGKLTKKEINEFLIYPHLNYFVESFNKKTGKFPKAINPLFYIPNPTDKEMGEIIKRELDWSESDKSEYTKHFDCTAEPLTNYVRNKIYGYERRLCQYSNMIRRKEITRENAEELYRKDNMDSLPENYNGIINYLGISEEELMSKIIKIQPLKYQNKISHLNKWFKFFKRIIK